MHARLMYLKENGVRYIGKLREGKERKICDTITISKTTTNKMLLFNDDFKNQLFVLYFEDQEVIMTYRNSQHV